jgi:hypothetical protein
MLVRDLKMQAMALATQLPDNEMTARRVHALLGDLIDQWIFNDKAGQSSALLPGASASLSNTLDKDSVIPSVLPR